MKTILAVDDSASIRLMVAHTIRAAGYQVVEASGAAEALKAAESATFDMVLTDQNMPGMDGLTLIRSLREKAPYRRVPIIVLTTEMSEAMKAQGRAAGASGWMVKPFNPKTLIDVVKRAIG